MSAASLRNVAVEAGLSIGSVRHYFRDHSELLLFAMEELSRRIDDRLRAHADRLLGKDLSEDPLAHTEELLAEILPLDDTRRTEAAVWHAFTAAARYRPELRARADQVLAGTQALMRRVLTSAQELGGLPQCLDVEVESVRLAGLLDGLTVEAVHVPDRLPPELLRKVVRRHLAALASGA